MKPLLCAVLILITVHIPDLAAGDTVCPADRYPVETVCFYDRGARVERPIDLALTVGRQTILLQGLPGSLDEDTFQLLGCPSTAQILEVSPRSRLLREAPSPRIKHLEEEIRVLTRQINEERDALDLLNRESARLDTYQEMIRRGLSERTLQTPFETGQISATLDFLEKKRGTLAQSRRNRESTLREVAGKMDLARRNLGEEQPRENRVTDVEILVEAHSPWRGRLRFAYVINEAGWQPVYEARGETGQLHLSVGARVTQNSGEDWSNVALTFSTARPSLGATAPMLGSHGLFFMKVNPDRDMNIGSILRAPSTLAQDSIMADLQPPAETEAAFEKSGVHVILMARGRANIPSGNRAARVDITGHDLSATQEWVAIPRFNPRVFRRLTARNSTGHPLLGGAVQLFHEGRFLGHSILEHRGEDEPLNLSLGQDSTIRIRRIRDDVRTHDFKEGTFTSDRTGRISWIIELKNEGREARTVKVLDHVPVSEIDGIKVTVTDTTTKPASQHADGIFTWETHLEPGQTQQILFEYEISLPKSMNLDLPLQ